ncbi:hypothetical protein B0H21DRAFT_706420 [Amylocystis lapponica]|nr:hypothetical protein B0H21DRAFT_706420 [Amylocystis lapponica]
MDVTLHLPLCSLLPGCLSLTHSLAQYSECHRASCMSYWVAVEISTSEKLASDQVAVFEASGLAPASSCTVKGSVENPRTMCKTGCSILLIVIVYQETADNRDCTLNELQPGRDDSPQENQEDMIRAEINASHRFHSFAAQRLQNFVKWCETFSRKIAPNMGRLFTLASASSIARSVFTTSTLWSTTSMRSRPLGYMTTLPFLWYGLTKNHGGSLDADDTPRINSRVHVEPVTTALTSTNTLTLLASYDILLDTDNLPTRYLSPMSHGAAQHFDGQLATYTLPPGGPCFHCLFPRPPAPETVGSCAELGVLGAVTGVVGMLQALEAIKFITGMHDRQPTLLMYSALVAPFRSVKLHSHRKTCTACGDEGERVGAINETDYVAFCFVGRVPAPSLHAAPHHPAPSPPATSLSSTCCCALIASGILSHPTCSTHSSPVLLFASRLQCCRWPSSS